LAEIRGAVNQFRQIKRPKRIHFRCFQYRHIKNTSADVIIERFPRNFIKHQSHVLPFHSQRSLFQESATGPGNMDLDMLGSPRP
jgi:hypothetical protein